MRSVAVLTCLFLAVPAAGHTTRQVKDAQVTLSADRIVLVLSYRISEPRFASDLRERFDLDADRALSHRERAALEHYAALLALEDLRVEWDGRPLEAEASVEAPEGLERALPSAYPIRFAWRLEYRLDGGPGVHSLGVSDREARWGTDFAYRVRLASGVEALDATPRGQTRSFVFPAGRGSFRIEVSILGGSR